MHGGSNEYAEVAMLSCFCVTLSLNWPPTPLVYSLSSVRCRERTISIPPPHSRTSVEVVVGSMPNHAHMCVYIYIHIPFYVMEDDTLVLLQRSVVVACCLLKRRYSLDLTPPTLAVLDAVSYTQASVQMA